jgi:hypothetical protein
MRRPVSVDELKRVRRKALALSAILLRITPPPRVAPAPCDREARTRHGSSS